MADVKCSKCGNIAHPGGFLGTDYKKWDGEIDCDNCYTELAKATASEREVKEQAEQAARVALNPSNEKNTVASVCRYMRSSTQFAGYSLPSVWLMIIIRARLVFCYSVLY